MCVRAALMDAFGHIKFNCFNFFFLYFHVRFFPTGLPVQSFFLPSSIFVFSFVRIFFKNIIYIGHRGFRKSNYIRTSRISCHRFIHAPRLCANSLYCKYSSESSSRARTDTPFSISSVTRNALVLQRFFVR